MKLRPLHVVLILITVIVTWVSSNISWGKDRWKGILESDAKGYYAYLPAVFIYNDLNFQFFDSIEKIKYYDEHYYYEYRVIANQKTINKYWCGTAICELPFFLAAHAVTKISGGDMDGYSKFYPIFINLAAIFYLLAGLIFVQRLLKKFGISEWNQVFVLFAIVFGTNLFYYAAVEPGMSHVYSFALIAYFLYSLKCLQEKFSFTHLVVLAMVLGLIFLVRPQNVLIVLAAPVLYMSRPEFFLFLNTLKKNAAALFISVLVFASIASLQFILYNISSGKFFVDSYPGEQFNFSSPHMLDILFSYKKGLFLYTPLYLLALLGVVVMFRRSRWQAAWFLLFFLFITYIFSSWHNWWYGGSFSSRVYVDYLILFATGLAYLLQFTSKSMRIAVIGLIAALTLLCQVQTYQYRYTQIHWDGMTKERYWDVFLRVDKLGK